MMIWLIVGVALAVLGGLLVWVLHLPEAIEKKRKKRNAPPPEPPKDWQLIAERLESPLYFQEHLLMGHSTRLLPGGFQRGLQFGQQAVAFVLRGLLGAAVAQHDQGMGGRLGGRGVGVADQADAAQRRVDAAVGAGVDGFRMQVPGHARAPAPHLPLPRVHLP